MEKSRITRTYNFNLKNIEHLSNVVYFLEPKYQTILKILALHGNLSQTEIANKSGIIRSTVRRKLIGASSTVGLIPYGFLHEKHIDKHRYGKQEKTYYLTLKGMLSSLPSGVPIKKFKIFSRYIDFLSNYIDDLKMLSFIEEYIITEIKFFLSWHAIEGINLSKHRTNNFYMNHFLNFKIHEHDFQYFPFVSKKEYEWYDYAVKLKTEFESNKKTLKYLIEKNVLPEPSTTLDVDIDNPSSMMNFGKTTVSGEITYFITQWPALMDTLQEIDYDMKKLDFNEMLTIKPRLGEDYEKSVRNKTAKKLMELGFTLDSSNELDVQYTRDKILDRYNSNYYSKPR